MGVLDRKVAVVVGGGRGLGRTIATTFGREGARVVLAARTAAELESAAREVRAAGGRLWQSKRTRPARTRWAISRGG